MKASIIVEVKDSIYYSVVEPHKKTKSFGKLVVKLLEAYAENDAIYSYINGAIDDIENAAADELLKDLQSMSDSLSMMNMLNSQAEDIVDNGKMDFDNIRNGFNIHNEEPKEEKKPDTGVSKEEVMNIVSEAVSSGLSEIKDMLQTFMTSANAGVVNVQENVTVKPLERPNIVNDVKEEKVVSFEPHIVEEYVPTEEEEAEASDALGSLLSSLDF